MLGVEINQLRIHAVAGFLHRHLQGAFGNAVRAGGAACGAAGGRNQRHGVHTEQGHLAALCQRQDIVLILQQHETFACHFNREILGNLLLFFQRHIVGVIPGIRSGEPVGIAGRRYGFCRRERSRQPNDCAQRQRHQPMALFALEHDVCPPH